MTMDVMIYSLKNGLAEWPLGVHVLVATILVFVPLFVVLKLGQPNLKSKSRLPPSPPSWPVVGHLPLLMGKKLAHQSMAELAHEYGDIYSLRLGSVPCIVVTSPEMAKMFLQSLDSIWASRSLRHLHAKYFSYNHTGIGFAQYTPMWRKLRKICTLEVFTERRILASQQLRQEEVNDMIRSIFQDTEQQKTVGLATKLHALTANITARMVVNRRFSKPAIDSSIGSAKLETSKETHNFKEIIEELFVLEGLFVIADYLPWLRPLDLQGTERKMQALRVRLDAFCAEIIEEHEVKWQKGPIAEQDKCLIDFLLHEMHEQDLNESKMEDRIDLDNLRSTIINMFAASTHTTMVTIEWGMAELIKNPDTMKKLKTELDTIVGTKRMVREADIPNLKYLHAVVKETFRLHPPGPLLAPHESMQDCEVAGYHIPAGTRLFVNVYGLQRSPAVWDRALEFDPERFAQGEDTEINVRGKDFRLFPFGSGRRGCPAMSLGTVMVQLGLAALVHAFEWSLPEGQIPEDLDMTESVGLSVPRANPLHLQAQPRLPSNVYVSAIE